MFDAPLPSHVSAAMCAVFLNEELPNAVGIPFSYKCYVALLVFGPCT